MRKLILFLLLGFTGSIKTAEADKNNRFELVRDNPIGSFLLGDPIEYTLCENHAEGFLILPGQQKALVKFSGEYGKTKNGGVIFKVNTLAPLVGFKSQRHIRLISGFMKCPILISSDIENSFFFCDKNA